MLIVTTVLTTFYTFKYKNGANLIKIFIKEIGARTAPWYYVSIISTKAQKKATYFMLNLIKIWFGNKIMIS